MSVEERLRTGLAANTAHLAPDLELEMSRVETRAQRRRQVRFVGAALVATAVLATVARLGALPGPDRAERPAEQVGTTNVAPGASPRPMAGNVDALEPGPWLMSVKGDGPDPPPRVVVEVPPDYFGYKGWRLDQGPDWGDRGYWDWVNHGSVSLWKVQRVVRDPCAGGAAYDPGPGVRDLARALHAQPEVESTRPKPVTVDGHAGLYVEVSFPKDRFRQGEPACHAGWYEIWRTDDSSYGVSVDDTVSDIWVLDVDGTRVVMVADVPVEDDAAAAEVLGIAASAHFLEPRAPAG